MPAIASSSSMLPSSPSPSSSSSSNSGSTGCAEAQFLGTILSRSQLTLLSSSTRPLNFLPSAISHASSPSPSSSSSLVFQRNFRKNPLPPFLTPKFLQAVAVVPSAHTSTILFMVISAALNRSLSSKSLAIGFERASAQRPTARPHATKIARSTHNWLCNALSLVGALTRPS